MKHSNHSTSGIDIVPAVLDRSEGACPRFMHAERIYAPSIGLFLHGQIDALALRFGER